MVRSFFKSAIAAALLLFGSLSGAVAQSSNPFNPDFAWCATPGSIATRNATPPLWGCLTPGTAGQVLRTNGPGANVSWQTVSGSGTVTSVGLAMPSFITVSGSPVTTTGTLTGTLASQTANQLFIAPNGSAGAPTFRAMVAADMPGAGVASGGSVTGTWPSLSVTTAATGGVITGTYPAITIANSAVTGNMIAGATINPTRLQVSADGTIVSNISGGSASPAYNTISAVLDKEFGTTQGAVIYRGAATWDALAPSTGGILQSNGAGANPSWVSPSAAIPAAVGIGHRLTLSTGTPVLSATVSAATTIYSTPYQSDLLLLWDGTNFVPTHCAEFSQTLADTTKSPAAAVANSVYDLFAWNDAGNCRLSRGPVWTNATTRSAGTAIARTNFGILTNSVAITNGPGVNAGTYLGTIKTDTGGATVTFNPVTIGTTQCVNTNVGLWNMYNRVAWNAMLTSARVSYTYSLGTIRQTAGDPNCQVNYVAGLADDPISAQTTQGISAGSAGLVGGIAMAIDSTTVAQSAFARYQVAASSSSNVTAFLNSYASPGAHFLASLEVTNGTSINFQAGDYWSLAVQSRY